MPASGPVSEPKMFPAAAMEDQEEIMAGAQEKTVLGAPPFSSYDPATDAQRMLPLSDGTSAHQSALEAAEVRQVENADYNALPPDELDRLLDDRGLSVTEGSGKNGNVIKKDKVAALLADDASDMKASDFINRVNAATNQEELDAVAQLYDSQDRELVTVEAAFEKKQAELNNDDNS